MGFFKKQKQLDLLQNSRSLCAVLAVHFARCSCSPQSATDMWTSGEFAGFFKAQMMDLLRMWRL